MLRRMRTLAAFTLLIVAGCGAKDSSPAAPSSPEAAKEEGDRTVRAAGAPLVFEPPQDWIVEQPTSGMRKAQYRLPRADGDPEDAECVVYFFGSMGGGDVAANIDRWASQFEQPDGRPSQEVLEQSERKVAGMPVHEVRLSGTYVAETTPGSGVRVNKPGFRLLAAILQSDHGDYFIKLVGPEKTVEKHAAAFRDFVSGVK